MTITIRCREFPPNMIDRFVERGYRRRKFFPHRTYTIPKCGPDAVRLAESMIGAVRKPRYWTLLLHAMSPALESFPEELFFDDRLIWHRQHYNLPGHIAYGLFVQTGKRMYCLNYVSDLVQRQSRRPDYRARIENCFGGWAPMLLNSILHFAATHGVEDVFSPTADLVVQNTDPARTVGRELFERIYDFSVQRYFDAIPDGPWWRIQPPRIVEKIVVPERNIEVRTRPKAICIMHDLERGLGQRDMDSAFAKRINRTADTMLDSMLALERSASCRVTYNVVGLLFNEVHSRIEADHHCLAFHSFNHEMARAGFLPGVHSWRALQARTWVRSLFHAALREPSTRQLHMCRKLDYRIRGYRPPQSLITPELTSRNLCYYGFDWLASARSSLKTSLPILKDHLVHIPVLFDDYALHRDGMAYERWESEALKRIESAPFVVFGLHDCYAESWLPSYGRFLERVGAMGTLMTLDQVADEVLIGSCD